MDVEIFKNQDLPCTLNWGYMVPNSGYLGPNRGVGGGSRKKTIVLHPWRKRNVNLQHAPKLTCKPKKGPYKDYWSMKRDYCGLRV